jgi:hypothetical protein
VTEVWHYALKMDTDEPIVMIPHGAQPLCVNLRNGKPTVYLLVDPAAERDEWHFRIVATGEPFPLDDWHYIGTWQQDRFVWHLFGPEPRLA